MHQLDSCSEVEELGRSSTAFPGSWEEKGWDRESSQGIGQHTFSLALQWHPAASKGEEWRFPCCSPFLDMCERTVTFPLSRGKGEWDSSTPYEKSASGKCWRVEGLFIWPRSPQTVYLHYIHELFILNEEARFVCVCGFHVCFLMVMLDFCHATKLIRNYYNKKGAMVHFRDR